MSFFYAVIKYEGVPLHPYPLSFVVADFFIAAHIIFYAVIKYEGVPLHPYPLSFVAADFFIAAHIIFYAVIKYEGVPLHPYPLSFVAADFFIAAHIRYHSWQRIFCTKKERSFLLRSLLFFITFLFLRVPAAPVHTVRSPPQTS